MATLGTLRGLVRNLVLERTGDTGLITDTEANNIIDVAARLIFNRIVSQWPEAFAQRSAASVTVTGTAGSVALSAIGTNVVKVLSVRAGTQGGALGSMKLIQPLRKAKDEAVYWRAATSLPSRWFVEGSNLILVPLTSGNYDIRAVYVPMPTDMGSVDGNSAWAGLLPELHDTIAILASIIVLGKDQANATMFKEVFAYIDKVMQDRFGEAQGYNPVSETTP